MNHAKIARAVINRVYFSRPERNEVRNEVKRKWSKKITNRVPEIRLNKRVIKQIRECNEYDSFSGITTDDVLDIFKDPLDAPRSRDPSIHP